MPNKQGILHIDDVDLNVVDTGSGEPALVFLHVGHIGPLEAPAKLANAIRFAQTG